MKISCVERDELLAASVWTIGASLTDADGIYGRPTIYTEWESEDGRLLTDRRWLRRGHYSPPDAEPCEHTISEIEANS